MASAAASEQVCAWIRPGGEPLCVLQRARETTALNNTTGFTPLPEVAGFQDATDYTETPAVT